MVNQEYSKHLPLFCAIMYDTPENDQLETVIYASAAAPEMTPCVLYSLLAKARSYNRRLGVTGALLYAKGHFLQILEGRPEALDHLMEKIATDKRHKNVCVLYRIPIEERCFPEWSLGFPNVAEEMGDVFEITGADAEKDLFLKAGEDALDCVRRFYERTQQTSFA